MPSIFQIDAFTGRLFGGNPAAVVPLEEWIDDDTLQAIAAENNVSETAFLVASDEEGVDYHLRWFTPVAEVDLCGHATLAAGHALFRHLGFEGRLARFQTRSGVLSVEDDLGLYTLDFPALPREPREVTGALVEALGRRPAEVFTGMDLMCVFENKRDVHECEPNLSVLAALGGVRAVIVTAPATSHDFVSRVFAPAVGIGEDPVTGSAHCMMTPYWSEQFGKRRLTAHQVSKRGGEIECELVEREDGERRVRLAGHAVTYLEGEIRLPSHEG
ncbi:MAG: PhzF family phenazine biosynthesis protein [Planctomycetota bacterium]